MHGTEALPSKPSALYRLVKVTQAQVAAAVRQLLNHDHRVVPGHMAAGTEQLDPAAGLGYFYQVFDSPEPHHSIGSYRERRSIDLTLLVSAFHPFRTFA